MRYIFYAAACLMLSAVPAHADDARGVYGGLGYATYQADITGLGEADLQAVTLRGGWRFTPNLAVEGELGVGVDDDRIRGRTVELDYQAGVFGVASAPVGKSFSVLARAGIGVASLNIDGAGAPDIGEETYWAAGVGGEYVRGMNALRLEYTMYEIDDAEADGLSLTLIRKF